jgi:hypothetical protein
VIKSGVGSGRDMYLVRERNAYKDIPEEKIPSGSSRSMCCANRIESR